MKVAGNGWMRRRRGMALLMVVMVLTSMLLLGTTFMASVRLDVAAARNYSYEGQTELVALEGIFRAASELMYDVWGVNEGAWVAGEQKGKAFSCAPEWGQLSNGFSVEGIDMKAAYAYEGDPSKQIIAHSAIFRRTLTRPLPVSQPNTWVQTDMRWVYRDIYGVNNPTIPVPDRDDMGIPYGGYYLDEFLPEHTDNGDTFEMGLHFNHGSATGRDFLNDEVEGQGGWWSGYYWPQQGAGEVAPWDYIDTRIGADSMFHIFRFDLVSPGTWTVRCTGNRGQDPFSVIDNSSADFGSSHLEFANVSTWAGGDKWGGAVNINQVNNNYRWEIYYNYKQYAGASGPIPQWTPHHYPESKWIYVYDAPGYQKIGRYAVLVDPDAAYPNANRLFDGPNWGQAWTQSLDDPGNSAKYLQAIDMGFDPHGNSDYAAPPNTQDGNHANVIKASQVKYTYPNCDSWAKHTTSRVNQHVATYGMITNRAELAMLLRKDTFRDVLTEAEWEEDARVMSSLLTTCGYEYLLDAHWEKDRIILDGVRGTAQYAQGCLLGNTGTRNLVAKYLDDLAFYWGPDVGTAHVPLGASYSYNQEKTYHYTPLHEPVMNPSPGEFPDPAVPPQLAGYVNHASLQERARRGKLSAISWILASQGCFHDFFTVRDLDDDHNMHAYWNAGNYDYYYNTAYSIMLAQNLTQKIADGNIHSQTPMMHKIIQVGHVNPAHPTQEENANYKDDDFPVAGGAPGFDQSPMNVNYYYVMLIQPSGYSSSDTRVPLPDGNNDWTKAKLYIGGEEILRNAAYRNDVFVLSITPDMDDSPVSSATVNSADDDGKPRDNSGGNDQTLHEDIWAWKGGDGGIFKRHTCWLSAWEPPATGDPGPAHTELKYNRRWGSWVPYHASTHMYTTRGSGAVNAQRDISAKKSHTADHPGRYITIFWKEGAGINVNTDFIAYAGRHSNAAEASLLDVIKLPKNISAIPLGKALAAVDFFNNASPTSWQEVDATFPWRNNYTMWNNTIEGYDPWASTSCGNHWVGGRAPNYVYNMWPEYRVDRYNDNRANGWHANAAACHAEVGGNWGIFFDSWPDLRRCPMAFMPPIFPNPGTGAIRTLDDLRIDFPAYFQSVNPVRYLLNSSAADASASYYPYNPYNVRGSPMTPTAVEERTAMLRYVYDPDLRIWMDVARHAPLNMLFQTGYLHEAMQNPPSAIPPSNVLYAYPLYDRFDNNFDGVIDIPTMVEMDGPDVPGGYYVSDRKTMARININTLNHPAGVWYMAIGGAWTADKHHTVIIGRRPFYGYTSLYDFIHNTQYYGDASTPYNKIVWWGNKYADATSDAAPYDVAQNHIDTCIGWAGQVSYIEPAPVYTVYVTAQQIKEKPDKTVEPQSEIKVRATVERTWDGRLNFLEFTWMPLDMKKSEQKPTP